jgi:dipeptidyl aminopeptidase/acylaminoacyl peptidase
MTDATVAPPEAPVEQEEAPPDTAAPASAGATVTAALDPALIGVPLPTPPGPVNASPDHTTLAFLQPDAGGTPRLWLQALVADEDPAPRPLDLPFEPFVDRDPTGDASGDEGPLWSPDGKSLALCGADPSDGLSAIWRFEIATGQAVRLTAHPAADRGPRWSPDGQTIAFTSFRNGRDTVCTVPAAGGPAIQWTDGVQDDRDPSWSRDGTQLAFRRAAGDHPTNHDIWVLTLATGELKQLTNIPGRANSKAANRRSPKWAPNRSLIAFVTDEKEWDAIAVVNPENLSGWTLADEPGDKSDVRWSPNGLRILYTRSQGAIVHCCAKGTSAAKADILDTQDGVARSPRWLGDFRVVYLHANPTTPWRFVVQDAKTETERRDLPPAVAWTGPTEGLAQPEPWQAEVGDGTTIGGLLYRGAGSGSPSPAVVALGDGPPMRQTATPDLLALALAATGTTVVIPNLRGTPGNGRAFTNQLAELADKEVEAADLADVADALGAMEGVTADRVAVAGRGFGGTLALLAAASRPGHYAAIVAIDPIVDWERELDAADGPWRGWVLRQFGLPALHGGRYALRSPLTFAPLLEMPVLLVGTATASPARSAQLDDFAGLLDELGVGYERAAATDPVAEVALLAVEFLRRRLPGAEPDVPTPAEPAVPADDVVAESAEQPETESAPEPAIP